MSTKQTIKYKSDAAGVGYHLYIDLMDVDDDGDRPVHLELNGVPFKAGAGHFPGGGCVDVTIPREWAEALGMVRNAGVTGAPR